MLKLLTLGFSLNFLLQLSAQDFSHLKIDVKTPGSLVMLDNRQIRLSDLSGTLTIAPGNHILTATKDGYYPFRLTFQIRSKESKIINIILEPDLRPLVDFRTSVPDIAIYNKDLVLFEAPSIQKLDPGNYTLTFRKSGLQPVVKSLYFRNNNQYEVLIDLKEEIPLVDKSTINIDRTYLTPVKAQDFYKPEIIKKDMPILSGIVGGIGGFVAGFLVGYAIGGEESSILAMPVCAVGAGLGGGFSFIKKKVTSRENVEYNRNTVPQLVEKRNREIDSYNRDLDMQIELKQMDISRKIYYDHAVRIIEK